MPLNYVELSKNVNNMYLQQKITDQQSNPNQVPYPKNPGTEWMDNYIVQYDSDANNGVFTMPAVVMISMPEMLRFQYTTCPGPDMPKKNCRLLEGSGNTRLPSDLLKYSEHI